MYGWQRIDPTTCCFDTLDKQRWTLRPTLFSLFECLNHPARPCSYCFGKWLSNDTVYRRIGDRKSAFHSIASIVPPLRNHYQHSLSHPVRFISFTTQEISAHTSKTLSSSFRSRCRRHGVSSWSGEQMSSGCVVSARNKTGKTRGRAAQRLFPSKHLYLHMKYHRCD